MQYRDIFTEPISIYTADAFVGNDGKFRTRFKGHYVRTIGQFIDAGKHYVQHIEKTRQTLSAALQAWNNGQRTKYDALLDEYKLRKWCAPIAMMQGVNPSHNNNDNHFESYTDVICLDIDCEKPHKEPNGNEWIKPEDWPLLKQELGKIPFVAYCGLSVGGRGLFLLIPIKSHTNHLGHWKALQRLFKSQNITIDEAAKNIGRLRFMSYDPSPVINHNAQVFENVADDTQRKPTAKMLCKSTNDPKNTIYKVEDCVRQIISKGIDLTSDYNSEWLKLGFSLASLGEPGRQIFHAISQFYSRYSERATDAKFTELLRSRNGSITIGTFFEICKQRGVIPTPSTIRVQSPSPKPSTIRVQTAHSMPPISATPTPSTPTIPPTPTDNKPEATEVAVTAYCPAHRLQMMMAESEAIKELVTALCPVEVEDDFEPI